MSAAALAIGVGSAAAGALVSSAIAGGSSPSSSTTAASAAADPFASQRGQYQTMLSSLVNDPSSVTSTPGYQYEMQQGEAAVNGGEAASGYLNSGNRATALQTQGQNLASTQYQQQFANLSALAGANIGSPSAAGQILAGSANQQTQAAGAVGNTVTQGLTSSLNNWMNPAPTSSYTGSNSGYTGTAIQSTNSSDAGGSLGTFLS